MKSSKLTVAIFVALILGVIVGWVNPTFAQKFHPLATIFLNMVKMIIAPLLFATLVVGIAGHGDVKSIGKVGIKTLVYFEVVTTLALIIGLFAGNFLKPGAGFDIDVSDHAMQTATQMASVKVHSSMTDMIVDIVPTSVIKSMADGNLLQIVIFSIF